jgi:outer membrane receptor protein involved in Fe transport
MYRAKHAPLKPLSQVSKWSACAAIGLIAAQLSRAADPDSLEPILVTAQKAAVQRLIDRKVYDVTVDLQSTTGTAADILNDIPSVEVDADGIVSLRGDSNVTILIDGKPSAQLTGAAAADGLFQLPASEIAKIEILPNPPAQFKADGAAGVINIITKKTRSTDPSGTIQASVGNDERYVLAANGNYSAGPASFSGALGLRQDDRRRIIADNRAAIEPATQNLVLSQEDVDEHVRRLTPSVKAQMDYRLDERDSLGFIFSRRERFGDRHFDQYDESAFANAPPSGVSDRLSAGREWRLDNDQQIRFDRQLARSGETLSVALQRSQVSEREHYDYTNVYSVPVMAPSYDDLNLSLDLITTEISIDYALPLAEDRNLKMGFDFQDDHDDFGNSGDNIDPVTGLAVLNPAITNYFRYRQKIDSIYGDYHTTLGYLSLQAGLRIENTSATFPDVTSLVATDQRYTRAYPSVHVDRSLSDESTLSLSLGRRVTHPDPEALNPYIDRQDTQNLRAGNPNLRPEDTQSFEIGYSVDSTGLSYGLSAYLRRNRDSVTDVTQIVSAEVVLITKENLAKDTADGIEFTTNGRINRMLSYSLSGNLFHDQIDAIALAATGLKSTMGVNAKASLDFHPTAADTAQVSFSRSDKRLTPQGFVSAIDLVNLGFKHQIRANLSAVVTVSDVFNGQILRRFVATPTLTDRYEREQTGRIAYLGIVYAFGASKKNKSNSFDYDQ